MKLLIVDDSAMVRRLIESAYRGTVFTEVKTAADGLLAVTMYKQFSPDVVTLDITMPNMDGLAALGEILAHNPYAKVLVISALADHHTAIESLRRGASQFICKPFTAEDLKKSLDEVINPQTHRSTRGRKRRRQVQNNPDFALPQQSPGQAPAPLPPVVPPPATPPPIADQAPPPSHYPSGYVPVPKS